MFQVAKRNGNMFENPSNAVYCKILEASDQIKLGVEGLKASNVSG